MSEQTANSTGGHALDLTLSVPAEGELRNLADELARKVAEHLGTRAADAQALAAKVAGLASRLVADGATGEEIEFVFRQVDGDLVVEARCAGKTSQVRQEIPV